MQRYQDWPSRLQRYLDDAHHGVNFRYGTFDCCLFVADCIHAMTGVDPAEAYRGNYRTRRQAYDLIRERTGKASLLSIVEHMASEHGFYEVSTAYAQRGDLALVGNSALGIVSLSGTCIMCLTKSNITRVDLKHATKIWRI